MTHQVPPESEKMIIGRNTTVDIVGVVDAVPAKVDTGADSSALWAKDVCVTADGMLEYVLFDEESPFYTGEKMTASEFTAVRVRSTTGHEEIRYKVPINIRIKGKVIKAHFNLSNRSKNHFPILIGRRTLSGKFIVDVSEAVEHTIPKLASENITLKQELARNPRAFYLKYHGEDL